jgi:SpoVK/Ycf46/Vps4 family AAA+-type ATPase
MLNCAHCQTQLKDNSFYCKKCGREVYVCINCGQVGIGRRCSHDGKPLIPAKEKAFNLPPPPASLDDLMLELDSLVGLTSVKQQIRNLVDSLNVKMKEAAANGYKHIPPTHFIFQGNPSTGKSTVARLLAKILHSIGLLWKGHLIEASDRDLVGLYVGQTAPKTNAVIDSAMGGVLFIDEAYTLNCEKYTWNSNVREAIETLLIRMQNDLGVFTVVFAGYSDEMLQFVNDVPIIGRISITINFDDYTPDEMAQIFLSMVEVKGMVFVEESGPTLVSYFDHLYQNRDSSFANGRMVRNVFEKALQKQADRMAALLESTESLVDYQYDEIYITDLP